MKIMLQLLIKHFEEKNIPFRLPDNFLILPDDKLATACHLNWLVLPF
jgi:hypothetical protein